MKQRRTIPYHQYWFGEEEEAAVQRVLRSGWLTAASEVRSFEAEFAQAFNGQFAVGVSSCTAGLSVMLASLNLQPGDEVITTPFTFASTANVILQNGATPVFADIDPRYFILSPEEVARKISEKTRAVIVVHYAGNLHALDELIELLRPHNIALLEDCAHALGATYKNAPAGSFGIGGAFSFYPNKNITTGEGGMILSNATAREQDYRRWRYHGLDVLPYERDKAPVFKQYDVLCPGYKYNMNEIQAALGRVQLKHWAAWLERRQHIYDAYAAALNNLAGVDYLQPGPDCRPGHHLFVVKLAPEAFRCSRDELLAQLSAEGLQLSVSFQPIHLFTYYRGRYGFGPGDFPVAERAANSVFSLPFYPKLTDQEVNYVAETTRRVLQANLR